MHWNGHITGIFFLAMALCAPAHATDVTGHLQLLPAANHKTADRRGDALDAVVWLESLHPGNDSALPVPAKTYSMVQMDKQFHPRLLVVPVGSMVSFPNKDPFFHNVFSLFNGKRFDLGLYEEGSTRGVKFSLTGVSYIFCNIHPEMSAVIVTLNTPYYAIPDAAGNLVIRDVPPGAYRLSVWAEGATGEVLAALTHTVHVTSANTSIGDLIVRRTEGFPASHKNKFGQNYDTEHPPTY